MKVKYKVPVLDKGYVKLCRISADIHEEGEDYGFHPASDLDPVADARVSTDKTALVMGPSEHRTLGFLLKEEHTSPFRGCVATLEFKAPLCIARQHWKYIIGSDHDEIPTRDPFTAWNEMSRRYVQKEPEFYIPDYFRKAPERRSQGSIDEPIEASDAWTYALSVQVESAVKLYELALKDGMCAEQARYFLPANIMYTSYRWTVSLQGLCHFLRQRLAHDAQNEITQYAKACLDLTIPLWPTTIEAMGKPKNER